MSSVQYTVLYSRAKADNISMYFPELTCFKYISLQMRDKDFLLEEDFLGNGLDVQEIR